MADFAFTIIIISYEYPTEQFVLFHCRIFYHRNIQDPPPFQWYWSTDHGWSSRYRRSDQYSAVSKLLPEHHERSVMRSFPAMV